MQIYCVIELQNDTNLQDLSEHGEVVVSEDDISSAHSANRRILLYFRFCVNKSFLF